MYVSGHVLASTLVSEFTHKKKLFGEKPLGFGSFLAIVLTANFIDADHLWGYAADDGTVSSFTLYLTHHFWWLMIAVPALIAMAIPRARRYFAPLAVGLLLHYFLDWFADQFSYNLVFLVSFDVLCGIAVMACAERSGVKHKSVAAYAAGAFIIPWLVLATLKYFFLLEPDQTPVYHIVSLTMNAMFILWALFGLKDKTAAQYSR